MLTKLRAYLVGEHTQRGLLQRLGLPEDLLEALAVLVKATRRLPTPAIPRRSYAHVMTPPACTFAVSVASHRGAG